MNKTVSINLSGQVFQIDEHAYDKLKNYLESIRRHFSVSDGGQEIIADIEARMAEVFSEKVNNKKQVITLADVDDMMRHMGKPEDFDQAGEAEEQPAGQRKATRRLYRDPDEKVVGGICAGLSAYLGIADPLWLRLAFLLAVIFSFGSPILIYIILWIIIPEAKTASEKLQMRGETINISNIERTIKDDISDLKERINNIHSKEGTKKARNFFESLIALIVSVVVFGFKLILKLLAVAFIIAGIVIILSLVLAITFPAYIEGFSFAALYPLFFAGKTMVFIAMLGIALFIGIPALMLTLLGFHILLKHRRRVRGMGVSLLGLWLVGLMLVAFTAAKSGTEFKADGSFRTEIPIEQPAIDTLFLDGGMDIVRNGTDSYELFDDSYFTNIDSMFYVSGRIKFDIVKSLSGEYELMQEVSSRGRNRRKALERAEAVTFHINQDDSVLQFDSHFAFPVEHRFRGQKLKLTLKVPEGRAVFIGNGVSDILYDVKNVTDTYDGDMLGHTWMMLPAGLTCLDCNFAMKRERDSPFSGSKVKRDYNLNDFDEVVATGAFDVEIRHGNTYNVSANGSQDFVDNIDVVKSGDRLKVNTRSKLRMFGRENRGTVLVTLPELTNLKISGASHTVISGFNGDQLNLDVNGASEVNVKSSFEVLKLETSGASSITLSGSGHELKVSVNGASRLKAFDYETKNCNIEVNGASKAEVNVSGELEAEAAGASEILYKGLPKISSDVSGFSSMKPSQ